MRTLVPALLFVILILFFVAGLQLDPRKVQSPLIGKPAPEFALSSLGDPAQELSPSNWRGEPYLLNVWGSWCAACRDEHPLLLALSRSGEIPIYGLNYRDQRAAARAWLANFGDPYVATAFDPEGTAGLDWGVYGAPETFAVAADGTIVHKHIGPLTEQVWRTEFLPLLTAARGAQ